MLAASTDNMEEQDSSSASSRMPTPPKPHTWRGVTQGIQDAKDAIEAKNLSLAEEILREILEFAPAEPEAWHILAAVLNRQGQVDEAKRCLRRVMTIKQTNISLQSDLPVSKRMAKLLWAQEDYPAAMAMLAELLLENPDDRELLALQQTWTAHT